MVEVLIGEMFGSSR